MAHRSRHNGSVGPLSKRAVAGIALAFGLLTLLVVILASNGGNDDVGSRIEKAQKDAAKQFRKGAAGGQGAEGVTGSSGATPSGAVGDTGTGGSSGIGTGTGGSQRGSRQRSQDGSGQGGGGSNDSPTSSPGAQGGQGVPPEEPYVELAMRNNKAVGGFKRVVVKRDDPVRLRVSSDVADIVRVDGYDLAQTVTPSSRAQFVFPARLNGVYEITLQKRGIPLGYLIVKGDVGKP